MHFTRRFALFGILATALSACASKFQTYNGPEVTRVVVLKEKRKMYLLNGNRALKSYDIALGFAPDGDKTVEGDGKTPEGHYHIDRRNPDSRFHLSLGISYPNRRDVAAAKDEVTAAMATVEVQSLWPQFSTRLLTTFPVSTSTCST